MLMAAEKERLGPRKSGLVPGHLHSLSYDTAGKPRQGHLVPHAPANGSPHPAPPPSGHSRGYRSRLALRLTPLPPLSAW